VLCEDGIIVPKHIKRYILIIYTYFILCIRLVQKIEYTVVKKMHKIENFETRNHVFLGKTFPLLHSVLSSSRAQPVNCAMG
jgi:hypothetical protein